MLKKSGLLIALTILFFYAMGGSGPPSLALDSSSSFMCDGGIVVVGSTREDVKRMCGEPSRVKRMGTENLLTWVYNLGETELVYYVSFLYGKVYRIQTGGYGD